MTMSSPLAVGVARSPAFGLRPGRDCGPQNLAEAPISIGGTAPTPDLLYVGKDVVAEDVWLGNYFIATAWPSRHGPAMEPIGGGTNDIYKVLSSLSSNPWTRDGEAVIRFDYGTSSPIFGPAPGNTAGRSLEKDLFIEVSAVPHTSGAFIGKYNDATDKGWVLHYDTLGVYFRFGATVVTAGPLGLMPALIHVAAKYGVTANVYVNGVLSGTADISGEGSQDAGKSFAVGTWNAEDYTESWLDGGGVEYFQVLTAAGWMASADQAALALQRTALLWGARDIREAYPAVHGLHHPVMVPVLVSGNQKYYFQSGSPTGFIESKCGGATALRGVLSQAQRTQLTGGALPHTGLWVPGGATLADDEASPTYMDPHGSMLISETATTGAHYAYANYSHAFTAGDYFIAEYYVQKRDRRYAICTVTNYTAGCSTLASFDFTTETFTFFNKQSGYPLAPAPISAAAIPQGDDYWLIRLRLQASASHLHGVAVALAAAPGESLVFAGDPTNYPNGVSVWRTQLYADADAAQTPIANWDVPITRVADQLTFNIAGLLPAAEFAAKFRFLGPAFTPTARKTLKCFSDGTSANRIEIFVDTDELLKVEVRSAAGANGDVALAGSVCDGAVHEALCTGRKNELLLGKDSTWGTPDTACDIPTGLTDLDSGHDFAIANHCAPFIATDLRLVPRFHPSWVRPMGGWVF